MYNSHPSDVAYGNPGFFVDRPSGTVKDSNGKSVNLRPDASERFARRILVRTSELPPPSDGVYTAKIRKAKDVSAIKLSYASIPRSIARVTAQLILYSVNIKRNLSITEHQKLSLQRLCRNQLLSTNVSDYPFFRMSENDFDWRNGAVSTWINSIDRNTHIPPQLESEISNQHVDIDILTVQVPSMCSLNSLGQAFSNALKSHSGAKRSKNNSLWSKFDISVEETGFSVFENINDSEAFTTFAHFFSNEMIKHENNPSTHTQSARNQFLPMGTPLTIKLKKSRSVYVSVDSLDGSSNAPAEISTSSSIMKEFEPTVSTGDEETFTVSVNEQNRTVYSFSCLSDVSIDDILEVKYKQIIEASVQSVSTISGGVEFVVNYYYGTYSECQTGTLHIGSLVITTGFNTEETKVIITGASWDASTNTLNINNESIFVTTGTSFFFSVGSEKTVSVSEVKRTYQKHRDVKLGLLWGDNKENEDFFIDNNNSFESPLISSDKNLHANYNHNTLHRRDVALLSQYSKTIKTSITEITDNSSGTRIKLNPYTGGNILKGMLLKTSQGITATVIDVISPTEIQINPLILIGGVEINPGEEVTFSVSPTHNNAHYNMLRSIGDLQDTYIHPTNSMSEIYNMHEFNDAHQLQRMLFAGHMMNVEEPTAMPMEQTSIYPSHTSGKRPYPHNVTADPDNPTSVFYQEGLGWKTSIVHKATRFIMPAFPVRFTQINNPDSSSQTQSIYNVDEVTSMHTSVSPLVARLLSTTYVNDDNLGYYKLTKLLDDNASIDPEFVEGSGKVGGTGIKNMSYYRPRDGTDGIVVTIGNQNYVVKSARLVSVLTNNTEYTLDLSCDRNYNSFTTPLQSIKKLERVKEYLLREGIQSDEIREKRRQDALENIENDINNSFHSFYTKTDTDKFETNSNARYFTWVFELDRDITLPTGIQKEEDKSSATNRTFNGIADACAMFVPGVYEGSSGRPATSASQQAPHNFFVRGSQDSENSLIQLHGIGQLERPTNSKSASMPGDVFAVMQSDDLKKHQTMSCESTTYLRNTQNIDRLDFSFISSKTGKSVNIGSQNATLIFDVSCSNE